MFKKIFMLMIISLSIVLLAAGCRKRPGTAKDPITVDKTVYWVTLNGEVRLQVHSEKPLELTAAPAHLVEINGLTVKALQPGIAVISIAVAGQEPTKEVTINICTPGFATALPDRLALVAGQTSELKAEPNYPIYEIEYSVKGPDGIIEFNPASGKIKALAAGKVTLVIGIVDEELTHEVEITVTSEFDTIEHVKTLPIGEAVSVQAVLTAKFGKTYFLQDATGAIAFYDKDDELAAHAAELVPGAVLHLEGARGEYEGAAQIVGPIKLKKITAGEMPEPQAFAVADITVENAYRYGALPALTLKTAHHPAPDQAYSLVLVDADGKEVRARINKDTPGKAAIDALVDTLVAGAKVTVKRGVISVGSKGKLYFNVADDQAFTATNPFKVTLDLQGGTLAGVELTQYVENEFNLPAETPQKAATATATYEFKGWSLSEAGTELLTGPVAITADTTIYAIWEEIPFRTVNFDLHGGTLAGLEPQTVASGSEVALPGTPEKAATATEKYRFLGWSLTATGTEILTGPVTVTEDITLHAIWETIALYTVTYELNGGELAGLASPVTVEAGATHELPTTEPTKAATTTEKYVFSGWSTAADGSAIVTGSITVNGDTTLYAVWEAVALYTVTYELNGGELAGLVSPVTVAAGEAHELPATEPTKAATTTEKYVFSGWSTAADGSAIVTGSITVNGDTTLYAIWQTVAIYTVTYELNGGELAGLVSPVTVEAGATHELPATEPTKAATTTEQYVFSGWSTAADGSAIVTGSITVNGDTTLYAIWQAVAIYTVTYELNGGELAGLVSPVTVEAGATHDLPTTDPTKAATATHYYTFTGWSTAADGSALVTGSITVNSNTTLYAIFAETAKHVVTIDLDGGSFHNAATPLTYYVMPGETIGALPEPFKKTTTDYAEFEKWIDSANADFDPETAAITGDLTIKALYKPAIPLAPDSSYVINPASLDEFVHNGEVYFAGENLFTDFTAAGTFPDGATVYVVAGDYIDSLTISQQGLTLLGPNEAIAASGRRVAEAKFNDTVITIAADAQGIVIAGFSFAETSIVAEKAAGIDDFEIRNNIFNMPNSNHGSILLFWTDTNVMNHNFRILGNSFTSNSTIARFNELENLTVTENEFIGAGKSVLMSGIVAGGPEAGGGEDSKSGMGITGDLLIEQNMFQEIAENALAIRRFSTVSFRILQNRFMNNGPESDAYGDILVQGWIGKQNSLIEVKNNVFQGTKASYHFLTDYADAPTAVGNALAFQINDNDFLDSVRLSATNKYLDFHVIGIVNMTYNVNARGNYYQVNMQTGPNPHTTPIAAMFLEDTPGQIDFSNHATAPIN